MDWIINWLREERDALMKAKGAFCLVLVLGCFLGYWAADTLYSHQVNSAHDDATLWHDRFEQFRDQYNTPISPKKAPTPVDTTHHPSPPEATGPAKPDTSSKKPAKTGSNNAPHVVNNGGIVTNNQSGGANTVNNLGVPPRTINVVQFMADLKSFGPQKVETVTAILGDSESLSLAQQLVQGIKSAGWSTEGPDQGVFSGPVSGLIVFVGATDSRKPGMQLAAKDLPLAAVAMMVTLRKYGLDPSLSIDPKIADPNVVKVVVGTRPT